MAAFDLGGGPVDESRFRHRLRRSRDPIPGGAEQMSGGDEWKAVEEALGRKGAVQPGGVFRVGLPRTDLKVKVHGVDVKAGFALGSYAAFRKTSEDAMVMGDLVLLDEE